MKTKFTAAINILFAVCLINTINAQTNTFPSTGAAGIGTTSPNTSSLLEIKSTKKGFLVPRMNKNQRDSIASPATGLLIYQTNATPGFYYYTGAAWKAVTPAAGWLLTGNTGTDSSLNFIGTKDAHPLAFRVNNTKSGWIDFTFKGNTSFGYQGLLSNTIGIDNTAIGYNSLKANISGLRNTAVGSNALLENTSTNNTAIGAYALEFNADGSENVAVGTGSLTSNTIGYGNTAMGFNSLNSNLTGQYNTALGFSALSSNGNGDNGNVSGNGNVAVGSNALQTNASGSSNTAVGYYSNASADNLNNATALGAFAVVNASNKIRLGDGNITVVESNAGSWTVSDGRFKSNIKANVKGLEFIRLLKPVTYNFDTKKFEEFLMQSFPDSVKVKRTAKLDSKSLSKASGIVQTGFIAQDVAEAAKKINYDFNGVHVPENPTDNWSLSYEKLVVPLVKAVQELSKMNDDKNSKIDDLQKQIDELKTMIVSNQSAVKSQQLTVISSASLAQNVPNPFTNSTIINYTLPKTNSSAQIVVTDKTGKTLKTINISGNKGNVKVDAATLASGAYQYSLIVDGRLIDTKPMIITK